MENNQEVTAQGGRIGHHSGLKPHDPLRKINLGDSDVFWNACQGAPWNVDNNAEYLGDATYLDHNVGVRLTDASGGGEGDGEVAWYREYDLQKSIHVKGTFLAGLGSGGNYIAIFCRCFTVYFAENGNQITVQSSSGTHGPYFAGDYLGDTTWRTFEVIYEYKKDDARYVTVLVDGYHICKVNIGTISSEFPFVGIFASQDGLTNTHYCKSFEVRSAEPWLNIYTPNLA